MRNGKYAKRGAMSKTLVLVLALALMVTCVAGGTLAWLTDKTDEVKNTFTDSDIDIELTETTGDEYQMIPGWTIEKDPVVTVKAGSEDCWLFIKVEEKGGVVTYTNSDGNSVTTKWTDFLRYEIDSNNWSFLGYALDGAKVYYTEVLDIEKDISGKVLLNNQVTVVEYVTKEMMNALTEDTYPTLAFTAYACQYWQSNDTAFTAQAAWEKISGLSISEAPPLNNGD